MSMLDIVLDTSIVISALRSKKGASHKLMSLVGTHQFEIHDSVALVLEYEDVIQRQREELRLSKEDASIYIESLCSMA